MEYTFPRTGNLPLIAQGELVASASSHQDRGYLHQYWHELRLVRLAAGGYVLGIEHKATRTGQEGRAQAVKLDELGLVPAALHDYDPIDRVRGYPPQPQYAARQRDLLATIQHGYYAACGRLLAEAGIVERV